MNPKNSVIGVRTAEIHSIHLSPGIDRSENISGPHDMECPRLFSDNLVSHARTSEKMCCPVIMKVEVAAV